MTKYGPGYLGDGDFLANHEWPKQGSCSGLSAPDYFASAVVALKGLGGDKARSKYSLPPAGSSSTAPTGGACTRPDRGPAITALFVRRSPPTIDALSRVTIAGAARSAGGRAAS